LVQTYRFFPPDQQVAIGIDLNDSDRNIANQAITLLTLSLAIKFSLLVNVCANAKTIAKKRWIIDVQRIIFLCLRSSLLG
jgi:hypothetical protein